MANPADWMTPAGVGAATACLVQILALLLQKSKLRVDDDAGLRKDLITERENLTNDMRVLAERLTQIEADNHKLRLDQIELQKTIGLMEVEKARSQAELSDMKEQVARLREERDQAKIEISRLESEIKGLKEREGK
jgi:chromosome segregation ATPase